MGKITFHEEMFDPALCRFLLDDARKALTEGTGFQRSNFHWEEDIRRASAPVLVRDHGPEISQLAIAQLNERGILRHANYSVMTYAWTRLSYIPWHTDRHVADAATAFLNDEWDIDWGGLFLFKDAGGIRGHAPRFNCGITNEQGIAHSTTPVSLDAPEPRFTLQLFSKAGRAA